MALNLSKLESVLARAAELDAGVGKSRPVVSAEEVSLVAAELGISPAATAQALSEAQAGPAPTVEASAMVPGEPARVAIDVATYLHMRGLTEVGSGVWEQRTGWWPDLYRYRVVTPVAVAAAVAADATRVTLIAGLDRIWRLHLLAGVIGFLAVVGLTIPPLGLTSLFAGGVQAILVVTVAWWSYYHRRQAIRARLGSALEEIGRPSYRLQPW